MSVILVAVPSNTVRSPQAEVRNNRVYDEMRYEFNNEKIGDALKIEQHQKTNKN